MGIGGGGGRVSGADRWDEPGRQAQPCPLRQGGGSWDGLRLWDGHIDPLDIGHPVNIGAAAPRSSDRPGRADKRLQLHASAGYLAPHVPTP